MAKTNFQKLEQLWTKLVRAWTGATQFVEVQKMMELSGTCSLRTFVNYLVMSRYIGKIRLLPKGCLDPPRPDLHVLPFSPPEKSYNLRSSTKHNTEETTRKREEEERLKGLTGSQKYMEMMSVEDKEEFAVLRKKVLPSQIKMKLKTMLQVTRKVNLQARNSYFEEKRESGFLKAGYELWYAIIDFLLYEH